MKVRRPFVTSLSLRNSKFWNHDRLFGSEVQREQGLGRASRSTRMLLTGGVMAVRDAVAVADALGLRSGYDRRNDSSAAASCVAFPAEHRVLDW